MRTDELLPALRVEVRRNGGTRDVVIVDPGSGESVALAEDLEASQLNEVNNYLWSKLDRIVKDVRDPAMTRQSAELVAGEIYRHGFAAMLMLLRHSPDDEQRVQSFAAARAERAGPLIVDVVADRRDRLIIEPLPLFGRLDFAGEGDAVALASLASVVAGFRAIIRHKAVGETSGAPRDEGAEIPIPVRFFRHNGLVGSRRELDSMAALGSKGKANVVLKYPPANFRPPPRWPELGLAKVLADPRPAAPDDRRRPAGLVCHFCCHQRETAEGARLELKADGWRARPARYQIDQIDVALAHHEPHPPEPKLCFLSACRSAAVDQQLILSAVDAMTRLRPHSVVGALASLPDLIAAEFAERFYTQLSDGWSVGAAIADARAKLLVEPLQNPLGLLFVSYFGEDVYFRTRADARDKFIPIERPAAA